MEDRIRDIAAAEGWSDATLLSVLFGVLQDVADSENPWTRDCVVDGSNLCCDCGQMIEED